MTAASIADGVSCCSELAHSTPGEISPPLQPPPLPAEDVAGLAGVATAAADVVVNGEDAAVRGELNSGGLMPAVVAGTTGGGQNPGSDESAAAAAALPVAEVPVGEVRYDAYAACG